MREVLAKVEANIALINADLVMVKVDLGDTNADLVSKKRERQR